MSATAVFLPPTVGDEDVEAIATQARQLGLGIYFNGHRTALLPRDLPGWFRLGPSANALAKEVAA